MASAKRIDHLRPDALLRCALVLAILLSATGVFADQREAPVQESTCVAFTSGGQVTAGNSFGTPIGHGLEFRLSSNWTISVGPVGEPDVDFLTIVSPPFRTAPHLTIGPAYGLTARESVGIERPLRFVLTKSEFAAAREAIESEPAEKLLRTLHTLARGTITFRITAYQIRQAPPALRRSVLGGDGTPVDAFEWIAFNGEACVAPQTVAPRWR
jgi:hypothetical protein